MFFGSGGRNESKCHQLARIGDRKIFHELDVLESWNLESWNQTLLGSGGRNESNNQQHTEIGEKKIFS